MLYTIEDLKDLKKVFMLRNLVYDDGHVEYVQYNIAKVEYRKINTWYVQMKHNASKSKFPKVLNKVGYSLDSSDINGKEFHSSFTDMMRSYCRNLAKQKTKYPELFEKMLDIHPEYFI